MQETKSSRPPELPEEALGKVLQATIDDAKYIAKVDKTVVYLSVQFCGRPYRVCKNMWGGKGGKITKYDGCMVAMCSADGLDYDTFARSVPERLDLAHRKYTLSVIVHRTDSGKLWPEITEFKVDEAGKERSREEMLEDATFRLNQQVAEMQYNLCLLADTQQKADSECQKLRKAYGELSAEYRSVVAERDSLRRMLGMEPAATMLPENILDISDRLPGGSGRWKRGGPPEGDASDGDILQAFMDGKI